MRYPDRLAELRRRMDAAGVDAVYLPRGGANLFYLAGIRRHLELGPEKNAYGDWACGALIGREGGVTILAPRMGGAFFEAEAAGKPWVGPVRLIHETEDPGQVLQAALAELGGPVRRLALDERIWSRALLALQALAPELRFSSANDLIAPMRMIKDADELATMRRASALADQAFLATVPILRPGVSTYEVAREIEHQFERLGADFVSFETNVIFTSPAHKAGSHLLRTSLRRRLEPGDSVTFDFGCVLDGYCSDFGRSAFVGEPPAEYERIHKLVLDAQAAALREMRAGQCTAAQANAVARAVIAEAGYDAGFTHRLGHGIGASLHEPPFLDNVDQTVLQAGMTFTVEPSVRIPGRFANRVEDVAVVTEAGAEVFNTAPHDLVVVG
jgi:Xaa-Pro aminopeptidase